MSTSAGATQTKSSAASDGSFKAWHLQLLTFLAVGVVGVLYFLVYVPARTEDLVDRNFRLLGDIGSQVNETVANTYSALAKASTLLTNAAPSTFERFAGAVSQIQPPLRLEGRPRTNDDSPTVLFQISGNGTSLGAWRCGTNSATGNSASQVVATLDVDTLFPPILGRYPFSDILVANCQWATLFQLSQSGARVTNSAAAVDLHILTLTNLSAGLETNSATATGTFFRDKVRVAGKAYKLFAQPITFSFGTAPENNVHWWICGLVRTRDFTTQTWAIPTTTTIAFIFVAFALVLLWPFLNISFCGPTGSVHRFDAIWALASSFLACATLTLGLLYTNNHLFSDHVSEQQLTHLALEVETHMLKEFRSTDELLSRLDELLSTNAFQAHQGSLPDGWQSLQTRTNLSSDVLPARSSPVLEIFWTDQAGYQRAKWTPQTNVTPSIWVTNRNYFLNLRDGYAWLWGNLPLIRDSVMRGSNESFYVESVFSMTRGENIAALSHRFSGEFPSDGGVAADGYVPKPFVSAITFQPLSLFSPHLPVGYGFCIIEPNGRVLFHSDGVRNLRENFITETEQDPALKAALETRTKEVCHVRYFGETHRVCARPVAGIPWTIITFRNEHILDRAHRNILVVAALLFVAYAVSLTAALAMAALILRYAPDDRARPKPGWLWRLWPGDPLKELLFAGVGVFACIVYLAAVVLSPTPAQVTLCLFLAPPVVIGLALLWWLVRHRVRAPVAFGRARGQGDAHFGAQNAIAYRLKLALCLFLFAMVPAFGCYKAAFFEEMVSYTKGTQLKLAHELQERAETLAQRAARWSGRSENASYWQALRQNRLTSPLNRYFDCFEGMVSTVSSSPSTNRISEARTRSWFTELYRICRPRFRETELFGQGLLDPDAADHSWESQVDVAGQKLTLRLQGGSDSGSRGSVTLTSGIPGRGWVPLARYDRDSVGVGCWYFGVLAAICAPLFFSSLLAKNVFLVHLPEHLRPEPIPSHILLTEPAQQTQTKVWDAPLALEKSHVVLGNSTCRSSDLEEGSVVLCASLPIADVLTKMGDLDRAHGKSIVAAFFSCPVGDVVARKFWNIPLAHLEPGSNRDDREIAALSLYRHYAKVWADSSALEKLTLYQIAQSGFVSRHRPELRTLLDRKLLRFDPELGLRNESFRRFVLATFRADEIAQALGATRPLPLLSWRTLRAPLGIAISAGAMFLFATQQELWQLVLGLTTSFATAAERFSKLSGLFQNNPPSGDQAE